MCYDIALTDKLAVFVDDARRLKVEIRPPCINASSADFTVEDNAVRYALGALKGVGERAMNDLGGIRAQRVARLTSLDDFAARVDPRLLNRRQLESLAGAGAFDRIMADRAAVFAGAEIILAHAASAADGRSSGQSGLFGDSNAGVAPIRLPKTEHWSLAGRMTAEREAFGFYFSAHPVDRYSQLARAHGARPLAEQRLDTSGRQPHDRQDGGDGRRSSLANLGQGPALPGRDLVRHVGGQFVASVFDEDVAKSVEAAARDGDCMLLSVELDRRPGEGKRRARRDPLADPPFDRLTANARLILRAKVADEVAARAFATRLRASRGGRGARCHFNVRSGDEIARAADASAATFCSRCRVGRRGRADPEGVCEVELAGPKPRFSRSLPSRRNGKSYCLVLPGSPARGPHRCARTARTALALQRTISPLLGRTGRGAEARRAAIGR